MSCIKSVREDLTVLKNLSLDMERKREEHNKFASKEKAIIAEYASKNGVSIFFNISRDPVNAQV